MNIFSFAHYQLVPWQWGALIFCGLVVGMSKTGISGLTTVMVPVIALIFGAKESTGIVLPMLCFADLMAVIYYRRSAEWKYIFRLLPWALTGFGIALGIDRFISSDKGFKIAIGACILVSLAAMFWNDRRGGDTPAPSARWFAAAFGILGGFSTMIGNAAGPIMSVFFLSVRLPKKSFVGTAAWFFLIINYLKIPLQYFAWHNISKESLFLDLGMAPFIILGAGLGVLLVRKVSEAHYRGLVYVMTLVSSALLFL
jgi:uncharacterized membrane protein YfcA